MSAGYQDIPLEWRTDLEKINTAGQCCGCLCRCGIFVTAFFGYLLAPFLLGGDNVLWPTGVFTTIGTLLVLISVKEPIEARRQRRYYQTHGLVVPGLVVDRKIERSSQSFYNDGIYREGPVITRHYIKVQYVTTAGDRAGVVIHRSYPVASNTYCSSNHLNVVVLPNRPKSGLLQPWLENEAYDSGQPLSRTQLIAGIVCLVVSVSIATVGIAWNPSTYRNHIMKEVVAPVLFHGIVLLSLALLAIAKNDNENSRQGWDVAQEVADAVAEENVSPVPLGVSVFDYVAYPQ